MLSCFYHYSCFCISRAKYEHVSTFSLKEDFSAGIEEAQWELLSKFYKSSSIGTFAFALVNMPGEYTQNALHDFIMGVTKSAEHHFKPNSYAVTRVNILYRIMAETCTLQFRWRLREEVLKELGKLDKWFTYKIDEVDLNDVRTNEEILRYPAVLATRCLVKFEITSSAKDQLGHLLMVVTLTKREEPLRDDSDDDSDHDNKKRRRTGERKLKVLI